MRTVNVKAGESLLNLLTKISEAVLKTDDFHEALDRIVWLTTLELGASSGTLAIPDKSGEYLKIISSFNHDRSEIETFNNRTKLTINEGVAGQAYSTGRVVQAPDIHRSAEFKSLKPDGREKYRSLLAVPLKVNEEAIGVLNFSFDSKTRLSSSNHYLLQIAGNHVAIAIRQGELIEKLQKSNEKLAKMARTDSLTGLPNHRTIHRILCQELTRAEQKERPLSVAMIDVDHFKEINDKYGHPAGDLVLKRLATIFKEELTSADSVGRYGGDEFLLIMPNIQLDTAKQHVEKIRRRLTKSGVRVAERTVAVTISTGVASTRSEAQPQESLELVKKADDALYAAKRSGRNISQARLVAE